MLSVHMFICLLLFTCSGRTSGNKLTYAYNKAAPPFVWDIPEKDRWFNVSSMLPDVPLEQHETKNVPYPKVFFISPRFFTNDMVQKFSQNQIRSLPAKFHEYSEIRRQFMKEFFFQNIYTNHRQLIVARDVTVDQHGHVYNARIGKFFANGGCHQRFSAGAIPTADKIKRHPCVISIAAMWGHAPFHFPIEAVAGLAHLNSSILAATPIHIPQKSDYALSWLALLNVTEAQVITDTVYASELLLPEMSRCAGPSALQLNWMRDTFLPLTDSLPQHPLHVVIVKRTTSRVFVNFSAVYSTIENIVKNFDLPVMVHSADSLPSLLEQINMFKSAALVVTTHGAAELFITFMPKNSCVIEYNYLYSSNMVYSRMAFVLGLNYHMNVMSELTMEKLAAQVEECLAARGGPAVS